MEKQSITALKAELIHKQEVLDYYVGLAKGKAPRNKNAHRDTVAKLEGKISAIRAKIENYGKANLFCVRFKTSGGWFEVYLSGVEESEIPEIIEGLIGSYEVKLRRIETEPFIIKTISTKELYQI